MIETRGLVSLEVFLLELLETDVFVVGTTDQIKADGTLPMARVTLGDAIVHVNAETIDFLVALVDGQGLVGVAPWTKTGIADRVRFEEGEVA